MAQLESFYSGIGDNKSALGSAGTRRRQAQRKVRGATVEAASTPPAELLALKRAELAKLEKLLKEFAVMYGSAPKDKAQVERDIATLKHEITKLSALV